MGPFWKSWTNSKRRLFGGNMFKVGDLVRFWDEDYDTQFGLCVVVSTKPIKNITKYNIKKYNPSYVLYYSKIKRLSNCMWKLTDIYKCRGEKVKIEKGK
jgi:hypothetical protein